MSGADWWQQQEQEEQQQQLLEMERKKAMFCDETFGDKLIEMPSIGINGVILGDAQGKMEIWDDKDPEFCYGSVPAEYTPAQIKVALKFYKDGYKFGEGCGRDNAQRDIRKALGFFSISEI